METIVKDFKVIIDENMCELFKRKGIVDIVIGVLFVIGLVIYYTFIRPYYRSVDYAIMFTAVVPFFLGYENIVKRKNAEKYKAVIDLEKYSLDEILDGLESEIKLHERAKKRGEIRKNLVELIENGVFINIYYDFERDCVDFL